MRNENKTIILASASPYKKAAMEKTGLGFTSIDSETEEKDLPREDPYELVKTLSKRKAKAVFEKHPDTIVIGIDSIAHFQGEILEKPESKEEAKQRLKRLSGKKHEAITGVTVMDGTKTASPGFISPSRASHVSNSSRSRCRSASFAS